MSLFIQSVKHDVSAQENDSVVIPYYIQDYVNIRGNDFERDVQELLSILEETLLNQGYSVEFVREDIFPTEQNFLVYLVFNETSETVRSYIIHPEIKRLSIYLDSASMVTAPLNSDETLAHIYYVLEEYELVEDLLLEYVSTCDDTFSRILGNINLIQGDYVIAIEHFDCIVNIDSLASFRIDRSLAWAYTHSGDLDLALELLDENTESPYTLAFHAELYAINFDYDSAIININDAVDLAEENDLGNRVLAQLYTTRAEIIFLIYEWDRVETDLTTAIELDPIYAPAYFQRGVLFYTMTRREDALSDFAMYLELAPDGIYAEQAQEYSESIDIELEALGG